MLALVLVFVLTLEILLDFQQVHENSHRTKANLDVVAELWAQLSRDTVAITRIHVKSEKDARRKEKYRKHKEKVEPNLYAFPGQLDSGCVVITDRHEIL